MPTISRRALLRAAVAGLALAGATLASAEPAPERQPEKRAVRGTVAALDRGGFSVQVGRGRELRVTTSSTTTYRRVEPAVLADATAGTAVRVKGARDESGAVAAHAVEIVAERQPTAATERRASEAPERGQVAGRVLTNDGATLTIATRSGETVTVTTTTSTVVVRVSPASAPDVTRGAHVAVHGTGARGGGFTAEKVDISPARQRRS